jgi:Phosphodiester glycosidase
MRSALLLLSLVMLHCEARRAPSEQAPSAAPSDAPRSLAITVLGAQERGGLTVRAGTLVPPSAAPSGAPWGFSDLELDEARVRLEVVTAKGGAALERLLPEGALAVVNGGYFEADFTPSSWLVSGGVELAKKSDTHKGGVLAVDGSRVYVGPMAGLGFAPSLAVQSFPLVVEADGKSGIHRDDGKRAARTVACLVGSRLHLIVVSAPRGEGPTLYELAELLRAPSPRGFGCHAALNLDGGPSSGAWFAPSLGARQRAPLAHVAYALAVLPR